MQDDPRRPRAWPTMTAGLLLLVAVAMAPFWLGWGETEYFRHVLVLHRPQTLRPPGAWGIGERAVPAAIATSVYLVQLWTPVLLWTVLSIAWPGRAMLRLDRVQRFVVATGALGVWVLLSWPPFRADSWSEFGRTWASAFRRPWFQPLMTDTLPRPLSVDGVVLAAEVVAVVLLTAVVLVVLRRRRRDVGA